MQRGSEPCPPISWAVGDGKVPKGTEESSVAATTAAAVTQRGCCSCRGSGERSSTPGAPQHPVSVCPGGVVTGPCSAPDNWEVIQKLSREPSGGFMPLKHRRSSFIISRHKNIPLASYPRWLGWKRRCARSLCSNGAALPSAVSLG